MSKSLDVINVNAFEESDLSSFNFIPASESPPPEEEPPPAILEDTSKIVEDLQISLHAAAASDSSSMNAEAGGLHNQIVGNKAAARRLAEHHGDKYCRVEKSYGTKTKAAKRTPYFCRI